MAEEKTVEQLQKEVDELAKSNTKLTKENAKLTKDLEASELNLENITKAKGDLQEKHDALVTENINLNTVADSSKETIADMQTQIEDLVASKGSLKNTEIISIGNKKYECLTRKFHLLGSPKVYTVEDLKADKDLQKKVLGIKGQGILKLKS